jgi:hypothetical protein
MKQYAVILPWMETEKYHKKVEEKTELVTSFIILKLWVALIMCR